MPVLIILPEKNAKTTLKIEMFGKSAQIIRLLGLKAMKTH